jgi:hypothetical protein
MGTPFKVGFNWAVLWESRQNKGDFSASFVRRVGIASVVCYVLEFTANGTQIQRIVTMVYWMREHWVSALITWYSKGM